MTKPGSTEMASPPLSSAAERSRIIIGAARSGSIVTIALAGLAVLAQPLLVRLMGNDRYGAYATITAFAAMVAFADLGLGNGLVNRLTVAFRHGDSPSIRRQFSSTFALLLLVAAVGVAASTVSMSTTLWSDLFQTGVPDG